VKTDEEFISALKKSDESVKRVAEWLARLQCEVMIRPTVIRPETKDRFDYIDDGDIEIRQRVEVKNRSFSFTSANDYPFETVIIDSKRNIDRIPRRQLWGHIILDEKLTHAAVVKTETRKHWDLLEVYNNKDRSNCVMWVIPKEFCFFTAISDGI